MAINSLVKHWSYRIIAPGTLLRQQYVFLRKLLHYDVTCHKQMADLQEMFSGTRISDFAAIRKEFNEFSENIKGMVEAINAMVPGKYSSLKNYHKKFDFYCRFLLAPAKTDNRPPYTLTLDKITTEHSATGNKARQLASLHNTLNIPVPTGFSVTADGYHAFIAHNGLRDPIDNELAQLDITDTKSLYRASSRLMQCILDAALPPQLEKEILATYDFLFAHNPGCRVAVRSSAICEDGENSFAGQFTTVLNVARNDIVAAYKEVVASKYSPEALYYRIWQGWGDEETAMSVLLLEMVDACYSGVIYTLDGEDGTTPTINIHAIRGFGEKLVSGETIPDVYRIDREPPHKLVSTSASGQQLPSALLITLSNYAMQLENFFAHPLDIEWAADSSTVPVILQARPIYMRKQQEKIHRAVASDDVILLEQGERASGGVRAGKIYPLQGREELDQVPEGAVLLTRTTPPDYVPVINKVAAVISEGGSRASHFATIAREFNIPLLCGVTGAFERLQPGETVTVDGDNGRIYKGRIDSLLERSPIKRAGEKYHRVLGEVAKFITSLELMDPAGDNFQPEGCRSMHDIIRFCHEKALLSLFTTGRPGTGRGSRKLEADIPLDVYLFNVGSGIKDSADDRKKVLLDNISSIPFQALWRGLSHPDVAWKQKPFDWNAYDKIELAGGVPPKKDSFSFASYAVIGKEYLHFNLRFGYHFTIVDVMCGDNSHENHCMLRFAGGGGDFDKRSLRIDFIQQILERLEFLVQTKGDLLEAKILNVEQSMLKQKLDILGRLLGATKLMDMVLEDEQMVSKCVEDFFCGRYSFSQEG